MMRAIGWLCYRIVMALPLPLPDCRENRSFAWILEMAGEYADPMTPNAEVTGLSLGRTHDD